MALQQTPSTVLLWQIYKVVSGYSEEWCQEVSGHIIKWPWHVDLQQVWDVPASVIHHFLHPTNSLITHWKGLIPGALRLTINSKAGCSGFLVYKYEVLVSIERFPSEQLHLFSNTTYSWKIEGITNRLEVRKQSRQTQVDVIMEY